MNSVTANVNRPVLPIDSHLDDLLSLLKKKRALVLKSPPGTGKTLRFPPFLAKEGRTVVLVPKRLAAVSAASRVAVEQGFTLGQDVGYQVRFDSKFSADTRLLYMTEGLFLKRLGDPSFLNGLKYIVLDEFHERSSHTDLILAVLYEKMVLDSDFKAQLIVMSATLDTKPLLNYLGDAIDYEITTSTFALQKIKSSKPQRLIFDDRAVEDLGDTLQKALLTAKKDILVFLPGLAEIRRLQNHLSRTGIQAQVEILHSSISLQDQNRLLQGSDQRRIILSTNIAESSLTLPDVDTVIDAGLEKKAFIEPKIGFTKLQTKRISKFSATQRAGRAARVGPGYCYQMWHEADELSMPESIEPEILKSNLYEEALVLLKLGYKDLDQISWLTPPKASLDKIKKDFRHMGFITETDQLTSLGFAVSDIPLNIQSAAIFIDLVTNGFLNEAAAFFAFIESADPQKINFDVNENDPSQWPIETFQGKKIYEQLKQYGQNLQKNLSKKFSSIVQASHAPKTFRSQLIASFAKYYSERIAQRKDTTTALSSRGRGVELSPQMARLKEEYLLILMGRDLSDSLTLCTWAFSISKNEFLNLVAQESSIETSYEIDWDSHKMYQIQIKSIGAFKLGEPVKSPVPTAKMNEAWLSLWKESPQAIIEGRKDLQKLRTKLIFLAREKAKDPKKLSDLPFDSSNVENVISFMIHSIEENFMDSISSLHDFMSYPLSSSLLQVWPEELKKMIVSLPDDFKSPNGRTVQIEYDHESAPVISIRLQDVMGLQQHPTVLNGLPMTFELLAPNMRPTQVTRDIVGFWKNSYFEVRKDLRARYPKQDWPEDAFNWKPEMSKRFQKK